jgi:hypothetical protein
MARGRDDADAAHTAAVRHGLAWHHLDTLDVHAALDRVEGNDHGWTAKAATLRRRLIPDGLDPDPLATIERQVAVEKADRTTATKTTRTETGTGTGDVNEGGTR